LFLLPLLIIFTRLFGVLGVQLCVPVADSAAFLLALYLSAQVWKNLAEKRAPDTL
jgi:hypothetical protein